MNLKQNKKKNDRIEIKHGLKKNIHAKDKLKYEWYC